jgi:hypothetical protein
MFRRAIPILVGFSVLASASDLKYTRKTRDVAGEHGEITFYYQGQRVRIDHRTEFSYGWKDGHPETIAYGPRTATIYQCDMHRILQLDFDHHQFTAMEFDRNAIPANAPSAASFPKSGAKVKVLVETRDTGETRQLFGLTARHLIITRKILPGPGACLKPSETTEDGWFVDVRQPQPEGCTAGTSPTPPPAGATAFTYVASSSCGMDDIEFQHTGPAAPPFPLEITSTNHADGASQKSIAIITELSRVPLDPQLFDLPTGYKHVDKLDESPNLPYFLRAKLMWQSVKTTVWGWTPWGK